MKNILETFSKPFKMLKDTFVQVYFCVIICVKLVKLLIGLQDL